MYEKFNILAADLAETLVTEERFGNLAEAALEPTVKLTLVENPIPPRTDGTKPRAV